MGHVLLSKMGNLCIYEPDMFIITIRNEKSIMFSYAIYYWKLCHGILNTGKSKHDGNLCIHIVN